MMPRTMRKEKVVSRVTIILAVSTAVCAVGWIGSKVAVLTLSKILYDRGIDPSESEVKNASRYVWKKLLRIQ